MPLNNIVKPVNYWNWPMLFPNYLTLFRRVKPCPFLGQVFQTCLKQCLPDSMSMLMFLLVLQKCAFTAEGYFLLEVHFRERHLYFCNMYRLALQHIEYDEEDQTQLLYHCEDCIFLTTNVDLLQRHRAQGPFAHILDRDTHADQTLTVYLLLVTYKFSAVATCRFCAQVFAKATSETLAKHAKEHGKQMCFPRLTGVASARNYLRSLLRPFAHQLPYVCVSHDVLFQSPSLLYLHLCTVNHPARLFICALCARESNIVEEHFGYLAVHMLQEHSEVIKCPFDQSCQFDIRQMEWHILQQHGSSINSLPYLIRMASFFQTPMDIYPNTSPITYRTPQATHQYPDDKMNKWVLHATYKGTRLPFSLNGSGYGASQKIIEAYREQLFGFKVNMNTICLQLTLILYLGTF